jgi:hypothetical protein
MRRVAAILTFVLFAGCNSLSTDIRQVTVNGTWRGEVSGQTFILSLQQGDQAVIGTGTLRVNPTAPVQNLSISGTYNKPNLTLTMESAGNPTLSLDGLVEGDSFVGNLTGGAFTGVAIALRRD